MGHPRPLFHLFSVCFKQIIKHIQQINVKKCACSIQCRDLDSWLSDYVSPPLTIISSSLLCLLNWKLTEKVYERQKTNWFDNWADARLHLVQLKSSMGEYSSWCYKTFLEEIWKIKISPQAKTAWIGHFESNKQLLSIVLLENIIVFTFLCRFWHQNKSLQYLNYGEIEIFSKKNFKHQLLVQILPKALLLPVRVKRPNLANVMHSLRSLFKTLEL